MRPGQRCARRSPNSDTPAHRQTAANETTLGSFGLAFCSPGRTPADHRRRRRRASPRAWEYDGRSSLSAGVSGVPSDVSGRRARRCSPYRCPRRGCRPGDRCPRRGCRPGDRCPRRGCRPGDRCPRRGCRPAERCPRRAAIRVWGAGWLVGRRFRRWSRGRGWRGRMSLRRRGRRRLRLDGGRLRSVRRPRLRGIGRLRLGVPLGFGFGFASAGGLGVGVCVGFGFGVPRRLRLQGGRRLRRQGGRLRRWLGRGCGLRLGRALSRPLWGGRLVPYRVRPQFGDCFVPSDGYRRVPHDRASTGVPRRQRAPRAS